MSEVWAPDWAIEKALKLMEYGGTPVVKVKAEPYEHYEVIAFATYIAQHEEAPVDPLQECLAEAYGGAAPEFVSAFRAALEKRGLEVREVRS